MSLSSYNKKRNFKNTAEPAGKLAKGHKTLRFVVQKHHASHLHYDFRLEMEGVLKSWAVPKGPSMNPADKRLAMMVEDHPYSYINFEGNIADGNYGAGNVIVWDNGTYVISPDAKYGDDPMTGLQKGHLNFILSGKKLKGEFSLVKLKNGRQENAWLLIKKDDEYASTKDVTLQEKSVISNQTLQSLAEKYHNEKDGETAAIKQKKTQAGKAVSRPVKKKPGRIKPMLAKITEQTFDNPDWIFETKYDGYRALAQCDGNGNVDLYSRNLLSFNEDFKPVADNLSPISHSCLLDGEIVLEDEEGISRFQLLQNYQNTQQGVLKYYVFDLLELDGRSTLQLSLLERKELLARLLKNEKLKNIIYSGHITGSGVSFFKTAEKKGWEGIVAKRAQSTYHADARSSDWLKIKITNEQEAVIVGITEPQGSRSHFGSLLLGVYQNNKLKFVGGCGTGFDQQMLKELYSKFKPLFTPKSPFDEKITLKRPVQWLKPRLVAQVKFTNWTGDGHMRHPVFVGLRKDKKATEVIRENENNMKKKSETETKAEPTDKTGHEKDYEMKVGKIELKLTNQAKLYWPEEKITKGDLIKYYSDIAETILPYLKDRPQSMHRFPNGIKDNGFYQKDVDVKQIPAWIKTEQIFSESNNANIDYLVCNDKATLIYMANLGCIEINPWNSRITNITNPDWMVIDLDPEEIDFTEVVKAANTTRKIFEEMNIESYCKTSGATGLHIFVPLAAKYDYEVVKNFAELVAGKVNDLLPATTSVLRMPAKRKHKVYIDFLQNRRGQTLAAPYSVRPRPGAPVSTPLEWKEVNNKLKPGNFTMATIFKRLEAKGDLWKPVTGKGANLDKAIKQVYEQQ